MTTADILQVALAVTGLAFLGISQVRRFRHVRLRQAQALGEVRTRRAPHEAAGGASVPAGGVHAYP